MPICQECKQEFEQNQYARRCIQKFCSRKCMLRHYRKSGKFAEIVKRSQQKLKLEVLTHYGNNPPKCTCCGESHIEFLSIDHINGGGNQHRKQLKLNGSGIYYWLKRNNFPEGFQVLCMNCNFAKGHFGICPHNQIK